MIKNARHIIGLAASTLVVALIQLQAVSWSFPIPGDDVGRKGTARILEMIGVNIYDIFTLPFSLIASMKYQLSGTAIFVCGSIIWGAALYGAIGLTRELLKTQNRKSNIMQ